jgi:hypothetical protein
MAATNLHPKKRRRLQTDSFRSVGEQVQAQREKIQDVREQILSEIRRNDIDKINYLRARELQNNEEMESIIDALNKYKQDGQKLKIINDELTKNECKYIKCLETIEHSKITLDHLLDKVKSENTYSNTDNNSSSHITDVNVEGLVNFASRLSNFIAPLAPAPQPIIHLNDFNCTLYKQD